MDYLFESHEAEWITEKVIDSKDLYITLEKYLRGEITKKEFDSEFNYLVMSFQSDFTINSNEVEAYYHD